MTPPIWLDEQSRPWPVRPCPRCGEAPVFEFALEQLRVVGWCFYKVVSYVKRVRLGAGVHPDPEAEGVCLMIQVLGKAT
jgi:hypothetical protein